jgi:hypothetical protein
MIRFSRTIRTSATGSGAAAVELIAGNLPLNVKEIGITIVNPTASTFALGRPAAKGITPTTPVTLLNTKGVDSTSVLAALAVAWGTGPTIPAAYFRQCALPATAGAEKVWEFPNGIYVPALGSIILWTLSVVSIADVYFDVEQ